MAWAAQYGGRFDGVSVGIFTSDFDVNAVRGLGAVLESIAAEGAEVEKMHLDLAPEEGREVLGYGLDRVFLPAEGLRGDAIRAPDHLVLIREGEVQTWVRRELLADGAWAYRLPLRSTEAADYDVLAITWQTAPAALFQRRSRRPRRGQPSFGSGDTNDCDDDCIDSNPFDFENRLRRWNAANYTEAAKPADLLDASSTWWGAGAWKGLLILHGTALQSHLGLRHLSKPTVEKLCKGYASGQKRNVIAFDHDTLGTTVAQNVRDLLELLPANRTIKLDILAISRGALIARYLAEGHANDLLAQRGQTLVVRTVVFVGGANDGTPSAGKDNPDYVLQNLDISKCMACRKCFSSDHPHRRCCDSLGFSEAIDAIGVLMLNGGLPGQLDLREGSGLVRLLNRRVVGNFVDLPAALTYRAIAGEYQCNNTTKTGCVCNIGAFFGGAPNDLVITKDSVCRPQLGGSLTFRTGANRFPISGARLHEIDRAHSELFRGKDVDTKLLEWLPGVAGL